MDKLIHYAKRSVLNGIFNPIVITDIDGVLLRGSTQIPGTLNALRQLKQHGIPLACLTNGGGQLQSQKVKKMNQIFGEDIFSAEYMFMNHSPVRPHLRDYSQKEGVILLTGSLRITDIVQDMKITKYVTADQLYTLFHSKEKNIQAQNQLLFHNRELNSEEVASKLKARLQLVSLPETYHQWGEIINSIFALNDVSPYQTTLEVIHNVFSQKKKRGLPLPPYFAAQNDIVWAGGYHRPRLAFGPFNYMLEEHCQRHSFQLNKFYFGKPQKLAFQFVQEYMKQRFGNGCFFMVGDNPRADIRGANSIGWASFLTQTGVHHGPQNDQSNPATIVVQNFEQAMELILRIKRDGLYL